MKRKFRHFEEKFPDEEFGFFDSSDEEEEEEEGDGDGDEIQIRKKWKRKIDRDRSMESEIQIPIPKNGIVELEGIEILILDSDKSDCGLIEIGTFFAERRKSSGILSRRIHNVDFDEDYEDESIGYLQMRCPFWKTKGGNSSRFIKDIDPNFVDRSIYYFELTLLQLDSAYGPDHEDFHHGNSIAIGLMEHKRGYDQMVGWKANTIGYHSDDGGIFSEVEYWDDLKPGDVCAPFFNGDVIGCGWCKKSGTAFFTKNGAVVYEKKLPFWEVCLLPSITVRKVEKDCPVKFRVNLGEDTVKYPFKYSKFNVSKVVYRSFSFLQDAKIVCVY